MLALLLLLHHKGGGYMASMRMRMRMRMRMPPSGGREGHNTGQGASRCDTFHLLRSSTRRAN